MFDFSSIAVEDKVNLYNISKGFLLIFKDFLHEKGVTKPTKRNISLLALSIQ